MLKKIKPIVDSFLDAIYPNLCIACNEEHPIGDSCFCLDCLDELPFTKFHNDENNAVEKHFWGRLEVERATALLYFHKGELVQEMIHRLKYKDQAFIGMALGKYFGKELLDSKFLDSIDLIIPIPIHKSKKRKRGYNQSSLIAKEMSKVSGIPWSDKILTKSNRSKSQTAKNREERFINLKDSFELRNAEEVKEKHVLIIDDILTTGATLEAASSIISGNGAKISIAVLAVGKY